MQHKKLLLLFVFILVAMVQIYVPAKMVYDSEIVLNEGSVYKFRTQPIDPTDPFRGKYITLRFDIDHYDIDQNESWERGQDIYVHLTTDSMGYAKIENISREAPGKDVDYVKATTGYVGTSWRSDGYQVNIRYPFDRFYMEESKAYDAEVAYRDAARDREAEAYALVHIKDGHPIVNDVLIDEVSIRDVVIQNNEKTNSKL